MLTFAVDGVTPVLAAGRRYADNAMAMTHQQFDARRGLPRLLGLLDEFDIKASFFVPGISAELWPAAVSDQAVRPVPVRTIKIPERSGSTPSSTGLATRIMPMKQ